MSLHYVGQFHQQFNTRNTFASINAKRKEKQIKFEKDTENRVTQLNNKSKMCNIIISKSCKSVYANNVQYGACKVDDCLDPIL